MLRTTDSVTQPNEPTQAFLKDLQQGKTNLAQGLFTCIEVINNDLSEQDGEAFRQMAFDPATAIARYATMGNLKQSVFF